jgi:Protein of unknown function (DUF2924)
MRSDREQTLEAEIARIRALGLDDLRTLWRSTFRAPPPPAFTKDLIARFICWHIQEQAIGGLDQNINRLLDGLGRGDKPSANRFRRLRPGTVLVREYQGERHTVTVVSDGYLWRDVTYASLSTVARAITGTAWSGPRFFGVRAAGTRSKDLTGEQRTPTLAKEAARRQSRNVSQPRGRAQR